MKRYSSWLMRLIGPALLLIFLWSSDWDQLIASFRSVQLLPVVVSLALMPVFVAVKAWRWRLIMRELGLETPRLGYLMSLYNIGLFLGGTTPGQAGDFVKAWYLRERGMPLPPVLFSIVLDRLFDFLIMAVLALLSLVAFLDVLPPAARIATVVFASVVILLTPTIMARGPREWLMTNVLPLLPGPVRASFARWRDQLGELSLRPALMLQLLAASVGSAVVTVGRIYLLFLAMSLANVPLLAVISSTALIAILQALPISFSGIGVRDAILIAVLGRYGYGTEQALALSALFLLVNIEHIVVGFLTSLRYPLGKKPGEIGEAGEPDGEAVRQKGEVPRA